MTDRQFPAKCPSVSSPREDRGLDVEGGSSRQLQHCNVRPTLPPSPFEEALGISLYSLFGGRAPSSSKSANGTPAGTSPTSSSSQKTH